MASVKNAESSSVLEKKGKGEAGEGSRAGILPQAWR